MGYSGTMYMNERRGVTYHPCQVGNHSIAFFRLWLEAKAAKMNISCEYI